MTASAEDDLAGIPDRACAGLADGYATQVVAGFLVIAAIGDHPEPTWRCAMGGCDGRAARLLRPFFLYLGPDGRPALLAASLRVCAACVERPAAATAVMAWAADWLSGHGVAAGTLALLWEPAADARPS